MSSVPAAGAPVDPDVDLRSAAQRRERAFDAGVLAVIAAGGVIGAEARYALALAVPPAESAWPLATWMTNVLGCVLLGALMVVIVDLTSPHRLVRPFVGVGILGGFTTFSTAMVEVHGLLAAGRPGIALAYLFGAAVTALLGVVVGAFLVRAGASVWRRRTRRRSG